MIDTNNQLQTIYHKLQQVQKQHIVLQKENERLHNELQKQRQQLAKKEEEQKYLRQQLDIAKSGIQAWHPEQKKLFVKRIESYLREIDKCLALLNE